MDDHRQDHIDPKRLPKRKHPKQQQTHKMPTYDVENTMGTNKERYLFLANKSQIAPCGTERMQQMIQRNRRTTLHWSAHPQREQDKTQKPSYGLDWLQNGI